MSCGELGSSKHAKRIESPIMADAEEADLVGLLEMILPSNIFQRLMSKVEDMAHPSSRLIYLSRAAIRISAYTALVEEANYLVSSGPGRVEVHNNVAVRKDVPANWEVLAHIALSAGWVRIGNGRLVRNGAGRQVTSPSPKGATKLETHTPETTTAPDSGQVELIVAYEADGARFMPRVRGEQLLEFRLNGQVTSPPASTLDGIYRWLGCNGYVPDGTQFRWLDRHEGRRRRRQVYIHRPGDGVPERRLTHGQAWDAMRGYRLRDL